jgi:hypothetical protein
MLDKLKNIFLFESDIELSQQSEIFIPERVLRVVLFLIFYVTDN